MTTHELKAEQHNARVRESVIADHEHIWTVAKVKRLRALENLFRAFVAMRDHGGYLLTEESRKAAADVEEADR